jgi:peptide/nickel transport system permease protein
MRSLLIRRTIWTVFAIYLLLSASFFTVALTPDPNQQLIGLMAAQQAMMEGEDPNAAAAEAIAAYDEARNRDRPLLDRYSDWVVGYTTFQWGWSYTYNKPVTDVITDTVPVTIAYMIPALLFSWLVSVLGGLYAALRRRTALDDVGRAATYLGVGVPAVIVAKLLEVYAKTGPYPIPQYDRAVGPFAPDNLAALAIPAAIVAFSMLVMQWRMVHAESIDLLNREFVTALRADGAGDKRLGRHVLKNATAPLLAVFNAEMLTVLFLTMYVVEQFLGIPGLGSATLTAFESRDVGLILATVMLPAFIGLFSNFLTDVISAVVDPRASS